MRPGRAFCSPVLQLQQRLLPKACGHFLISATKKKKKGAQVSISTPFPLPSTLWDLPAFSKSLHIIQAVTDVISLGLATTVFPHAMAGAIFQVNKYNGKFQGLIKPAAKQNHRCQEFSLLGDKTEFSNLKQLYTNSDLWREFGFYFQTTVQQICT